MTTTIRGRVHRNPPIDITTITDHHPVHIPGGWTWELIANEPTGTRRLDHGHTGSWTTALHHANTLVARQRQLTRLLKASHT